LSSWLPSSNTGSSDHCRQKGRLAVVLLHLQATLRWADRVAADDPAPSRISQSSRATYPAHLVSEVMSFNGVMPDESFGELSSENQLRLSHLNNVPYRPMSARFTLADNSIDSETILDKIITMGIPGTHVTCIQWFRWGQVDVTIAKRESRELFLCKVTTTFERRPTAPWPTWQSGIYVTVQDAPWELPDDLIKQCLQKYGTVFSIRRAFNQSLLPEKVPDGRRVLRMVVRQPMPPLHEVRPVSGLNILSGAAKNMLEVQLPRSYREGLPGVLLFSL